MSGGWSCKDTMGHNIGDDVLIALRRIIRAIDIHSRFLAQRYGLTVPQLVILQELRRLGEASGSELAKAVSLSQATVTGIVMRLETRGLVMRRRSESDKRRLPVRLAPAGERLLESAPPLLQESFSRQFHRLRDWEKSQILSSLQRLVAMMEAHNVDIAPFLGSDGLGPEVEVAVDTALYEELAPTAQAPVLTPEVPLAGKEAPVSGLELPSDEEAQPVLHGTRPATGSGGDPDS